MKIRSLRGQPPTAKLSVLFAATLAVVACGSGGDDPAPPPAPVTTLTGVVASGAAVPGATVTISDASATTANVSATSGADGSYSADVTALTAPLLVTATGTLNGEAVSLAAVVPAAAVTGAASNTANVTSLTNAIAALIAPAGNIGALTDPAALTAAATEAGVTNASQLVVNTLRTDPVTNAALGDGFDPLRTTFSANGSGVDGVLDSLEITTGASGVTITNLAAPVSGSGSQSVTLTPAQTATPTVVPTLPPSATAGTLPTAAEMTALALKFEACLAEPVSSRVTLNADGIATAVSAACNFAPAGWRSAGLDWVTRLGSFTFSRDYLTGSKAGAPTISVVFPPANRSGNEFQHPNCNTDTCVVMRVPMVSANGQPWTSDWQLGKLNGQWDFVGNHVPYPMGAEHRMLRKTQVNTALAAANPTNYFAQDRTEAVLRLSFDSTLSDTSQVRAVRWTGPGLPAAGVVTVRSQRCMTGDRLVITNQQGSLDIANAPGQQQWWTGGSAADFVLSAAKADGSAMTMPVPTGDWASNPSPASQEFSPAPITSPVSAWSEYRAEVFYYSNTGTTPDEVIHVRNNSPYESAAQGALIAWPSLAQTTIDAFLKPGGASAGLITDVAQSISYTNPAGNYIVGAWMFSQNRMSVTNGEGETANQWLRGLINLRPTAFGDTSMTGQQWNNPRSGTSFSPSTASNGSNPNPRCTAELVALEGDATNLSYREQGLSFRGAGFKLYQDIHFWSN